MLSIDVGARKVALHTALSAIEKQFGKGAIMRLDGPAEAVEVIPTGSVGLDLALGCGGYPRGRVIEIYGPEASGKTTLALHAMAEIQRLGGTAAFIDAEHALDPSYAARLGVRVPELILAQPDDGEQALDIVEALVRSTAVDLVVVDSVAALVPKAEIEGEMGDLQLGSHARMMSKAMRKLVAIASRSATTVLFINQIRQKIGVTFGPSEVTTGGNALKYYASIRLDVRRVSTLKKAEVAVGARTRVKVVKNKLAPPFRTVEFDILYGTGIHQVGEVIELAESQGGLVRHGTWYVLGETRVGPGRERLLEHLDAHPEVVVALRGQLSGERLRVVAEA
ncbi:MAG: recombinase RecA [Myxococcales bacterium]|nr:recombinase RecA [Myxococcales bacterium]